MSCGFSDAMLTPPIMIASLNGYERDNIPVLKLA